jgi:hypothetical protein
MAETHCIVLANIATGFVIGELLAGPGVCCPRFRHWRDLAT